MTIALKVLRILLIVILSLILIITTIFIVDRYLIHTSMKGISPVDMKHIALYLVLPLSLLLLVIWSLEKFSERKK